LSFLAFFRRGLPQPQGRLEPPQEDRRLEQAFQASERLGTRSASIPPAAQEDRRATRRLEQEAAGE